MNIYVGNLPLGLTEAELSSAFEAFGPVASATIIKDRFSGESRGFGFVEINDRAKAMAAIEAVNGTEIQGRSLIVNEARPRMEARPANRRGGKRSW
ncbi:MAG: RNA-binding protein [Bacteroidota bacterium]|nr:RNA-binding protein [Bacteroidota bacterium]